MFSLLPSRSSCFASCLAVLTLWLSMLCLSSVAHAATLTVPAQYPTIQAAVNASFNGDTVLVADGTYIGDGNRDIDFNGKNITVTSVNGPITTIIDCGGFTSTDGSGNHRGFYIHSGETNAAISGFTVENGYETIVSSIPDSGFGGGVYTNNNGGTITLANCVITNNEVSNGNYNLADGGGGVANHINKGGTTTITNCTIANNRASYIGGIENFNRGGTITLTNCAVTNNRAIYNGGAAYTNNYGGTTVLTNCTFTNNIAGSRGGVENFNYNGGTITLTNCTVANNLAASHEGGGVMNSNHGVSSTITLTNCTVTNNTAGTDGGGVYNNNNYDVDSTGAITLTNCTITSNTASNDSGGGVYNYNYGGSSGRITLTNCTVTHNKASIDGSGVFNKNDSGSNGTITLTNCIAYADTNDELINNSSTTASIIVNYSDIQGSYLGTGNINADPLFVRNPNPTATPPDYGDLHLQFGSPCLSAGTASGAPATDITGAARPTPPSIGAYEQGALQIILTAAAGPGKVTLSWTAPSGVSGANYSVFRSTNPGGETSYLAAGTATSYVDTNVVAGTKYYYLVRAYVYDPPLATSNEASATPTTPVLGKVRYFPRSGYEYRLVGGVFQGSSDNTTWTTLYTVTAKPSSGWNEAAVTLADPKRFRFLRYLAPNGSYGNVAEIEFYTGAGASAVKLIGQGFGTPGSYNNSGNGFAKVLDGNTSTYFDAPAPGNGDFAGIDQAPPPTAPTGLTATGGSKITLTWTASPLATSYSLYRATAAGSEGLYMTGLTGTSYTDTAVTAGTLYYYTLKAVNTSGTSAASNEAHAATGSLSGSSAPITASQTINLTTLGTTDWAHWGTATATSFDHKAASGTTPVGLLSNYTVVGSGTVIRYPTSLANCTWTAGTPTVSATNSGEVYVTGTGNGFQLTVPADLTRRTLTLYVGGYKDTATLTAHLSDGSAVDFVDASYGSNKPGSADGAHYQAVYTLSYGAASAGQALTVSWVQTSAFTASGNVTLQAATLAITP